MNPAATVLLTFLLGCSASGPTLTIRSTRLAAQSVPAAAGAASAAPGAHVPIASASAASETLASVSAPPVPAAYEAIRELLRPSGVPVLLPDPLPRGIERARSINVVTADWTGYSVAYSTETQCFEALSCSFFHVSGFAPTALADRSFRQDRPVELSDGTRGFFRPEDCTGASCTEASLTFERVGGIYEIDVKVGPEDLRVLTRAYRNLRVFH